MLRSHRAEQYIKHRICTGLYTMMFAHTPSTVALTLLFSSLATAKTTYTVPAAPPNTNVSLVLNEAPLGISFEFFAFPAWEALAGTQQCLNNLGYLAGALPPVRIGGTTQYVVLVPTAPRCL